MTEMTAFPGLSVLRGCPDGSGVPEWLRPAAVDGVRRIHEGVPGYRATPLVRLDALAGALGVRAVFVKDESQRFGLNAFKALGGIYALVRTVCRELALDPGAVGYAQLCGPEMRARTGDMVFATATDGNHGRGVAWAAAQLGCRTHVLMPRGTAPARARAIAACSGGLARAEITELTYDGAVRRAAGLARENGWFLIQDTSWPGYEEVPRWIIQGYTTMAAEAAEQLLRAGFGRPTHVFLQAGVGAMAGGVTGYLCGLYGGERPVFALVEPDAAACLFASARAGGIRSVSGGGGTIMAGLDCGSPCTLAWPVLYGNTEWYFSCPDAAAAYGARLLGAPLCGDARVISGESGAAAAGVFALAAGRPENRALRAEMGLDENSVVLLFSTEGDTDAEMYRRIVHGGAFPLPEGTLRPAGDVLK